MYVCIGRNTNLAYRCLSHSSSCYSETAPGNTIIYLVWITRQVVWTSLLRQLYNKACICQQCMNTGNPRNSLLAYTCRCHIAAYDYMRSSLNHKTSLWTSLCTDFKYHILFPGQPIIATTYSAKDPKNLFKGLCPYGSCSSSICSQNLPITNYARIHIP